MSIETLDPSRQEIAMSGEASGSAVKAAPNLGPTFRGPGTATKAELTWTNTKNTEVGWGVVHFYREAEETGSGDVPNDEQEVEAVEDGATLCIPAVPAYMSPGDFLGFVGERWINDISHCRTVTTAQMNRYLALLRFRDKKRAQEWKNEFDGKVFNTVEVSRVELMNGKLLMHRFPSLKYAMLFSSRASPSRHSGMSHRIIR